MDRAVFFYGDAPGGVRLAFFHDPDGNLLELVSNLPNMEPYQPGWDTPDRRTPEDEHPTRPQIHIVHATSP